MNKTLHSSVSRQKTSYASVKPLLAIKPFVLMVLLTLTLLVGTCNASVQAQGPVESLVLIKHFLTALVQAVHEVLRAVMGVRPSPPCLPMPDPHAPADAESSKASHTADSGQKVQAQALLTPTLVQEGQEALQKAKSRAYSGHRVQTRAHKPTASVLAKSKLAALSNSSFPLRLLVGSVVLPLIECSAGTATASIPQVSLHQAEIPLLLSQCATAHSGILILSCILGLATVITIQCALSRRHVTTEQEVPSNHIEETQSYEEEWSTAIISILGCDEEKASRYAALITPCIEHSHPLTHAARATPATPECWDWTPASPAVPLAPYIRLLPAARASPAQPECLVKPATPAIPSQPATRTIVSQPAMCAIPSTATTHIIPSTATTHIIPSTPTTHTIPSMAALTLTPPPTSPTQVPPTNTKDSTLSDHQMEVIAMYPASRRSLVRKIVAEEKRRNIQLDIVKVGADGNCFFYALSHLLFGDTTHHAKLRKQASDWLAANGDFQMTPDLLLKYTEDNWDYFVSKMRNDKEYATVACIHALSELYSTTVNVVTFMSADYTIRPHYSKSTREVWICYCDEHYCPLVLDPNRDQYPDLPATLPSCMWNCTICTRWMNNKFERCTECDIKRIVPLRLSAP